MCWLVCTCWLEAMSSMPRYSRVLYPPFCVHNYDCGAMVGIEFHTKKSMLPCGNLILPETCLCDIATHYNTAYEAILLV